MNDEAAESPGPTGPSPDQPAPTVTPAPPADPPTSALPPPAATPPPAAGAKLPPAWQPPPDGVPQADQPQAGATGSAPPPPETNTPPPPGTNQPPGTTGLGGMSFSRDRLVRPQQGRYLAGVCAALGRATNTDPVLWRVLLAVLGVLTGVGVLLYLIGWLMIPAEGDTASPIESLFGRGRSGMTPFSVVLLGVGAVLSFAFIVNDGMRTGLIAGAVILGAVLLIKRGGAHPNGLASMFSFGRNDPPTVAFGQAGTFPFGGTPAPGPVPPRNSPADSSAAASGYRPPFAPYGPYVGFTAPEQQAATKPIPAPKPPRERSQLGRLTFFAVMLVIGLLAVLHQAGAYIPISAYFAAALATIGLGLVLGAWIGRARGLIALALLTTVGLVVTTSVDRWGGELGNSVYRPTTAHAIADRYDFTAGSATLDLRGVDFAGQQRTVIVTMNFGLLKVQLPSAVDTTAKLRVDNGQAAVFGNVYDGTAGNDRTLTDLGADGTGGGQLTLDLRLDTGNVEVTR